MKINKFYMGLAVAAGLLASCKNNDAPFPDFTFSNVYFATQYPVRTVVLGEDLIVDNTLDNQRKVSIKATMGGVYENKKDVVIDFKVDPTLLNNLYFNGGAKIDAMPSQYYQLASNKITIPSGSILGGVDVQLTDAFFADPRAITRSYVIPLSMTGVTGVDSVLKRKSTVLYAVKYVNPWHANYLRRGLDQITNAAGVTTANVRHAPFVENDQVVSTTTTSLTSVNLPVTIKNNTGANVTVTLALTFASNGTCTVSGNSADFDVAGTGKFVSKGEKNSLGGSDRSAIYLDYTVNYKTQNIRYATKDTMVVRDRGIKAEYFEVQVK
jgi:hypothetical protein